ncbi:ABC transporter permease [Candidatus Kaiserbacteria bacterium]|nr:ABC transporter permease [Candidatus Kaiserbacteria bacterium]
MWTGFKRMMKGGFVGFWRNAFVSMAAIFVMTVALFVVGSTMMVDKLLGVSLENIQDKVDINVYFVTTAAEPEIFRIQSMLEALPEVEEVTYTSREMALEQFSNRYQEDETIMRGLAELGDNPLGASLSIRAEQTSQYEGIDAFLREQKAAEDPQEPLIDEINYLRNKEAIDRLTSIISAVEKFSLAAMAILVLASVLITFNTIRLAIYTTRDEISVMRLVGASNSFIRGPFLLQGVMYGVIAGVLAILLLYPIVLSVGPQTEQFFQFNLFGYFVSDFTKIFFTLVGAGVALGIVSSLLAVARYLRI